MLKKAWDLSENEIVAQLERYAFYHIIPVTETITTPGVAEFARHNPPILRLMDAVDFRGKRVVDVGCRDGLFCFEAERRGAAEVIGIDTSLSRGAVEFLIPYLRSKVKMRELSLFDLHPGEHGLFDVVLLPGVLYHLRYPFLALRTLSSLLIDRGRMVVETALFADTDERALLFCPVGEESPYEPSSVSFYNRKGLIDTLGSFGLRVDATDYISEEDRRRADGSIVRGTFLCTKVGQLMAEHPHHYWSGGIHVNWQKGGPPTFGMDNARRNDS